MKTYRLLYFLLIIFYTTVADSQQRSSSTKVDSSVENNQKSVTIHHFNDESQSFIIHFDNNRRMINRSSFLERAKQWLNQSDRENKEWINDLNYTMELLCIMDMELYLYDSNHDHDEDEYESCLQEIEPISINIQQQLLQHQASRILYPDNYKPVDSLDQSLVNEVETLFDAGCDICRHPDVAQMLIYGSPQQSNQALDQLKRMGDACLRAMIVFLQEGVSGHRRYDESYNRFLLKLSSIPNRCQQESNHPICQNILTNNRMIQRRLSLLTAQIQHNPQTVESYLSQETILSDTQSFLNEINDHLLCSEYSIGEEREKVGDIANYIVKKENNNHYKISVSIKFTSIAPADPFNTDHGFSGSDGQEVSEAYDHHIHTHFLNKARQCMNQVNPKMLGPRGEKLEIVLEDAYEKKDICTPAHTITITLPNFMMTRFDEYSSNIDCPIILHELLHIFGLEDEYDKSWSTDEIWDDEFENPGYPEYSSIIPSTNNNDSPYIEQYNSIMANVLDRWNNVFKSGQDVSLLDPIHFNVILYNNCPTRNDVKLYNDCYNFNYSDITLISQCKRQNLLGRSKQRELEILESEISSNNSLRLKLEYAQENSRDTKINIQEQFYYEYINRVIERKRAVEAWPDD